MRWMTRLLMALLLTLAAGAHAASFYKWQDASGQWHFSDQRPSGVEAQTGNVRTTPPAADTATTNRDPAPSPAEPKRRTNQRVVMYSTEWCGYCKKARAFFRKNRIAFSEYDIEKSAKAKRDHERNGGGGVPLILVGKQKVRGFDQGRLTQLLGL